MAIIRQDYGSIGGGIPEAELKEFTIAYGTSVVLNFDKPHSEFMAIKSDGVNSSKHIISYIISDGIKSLNSNLYNWHITTSASDDGGIAWSNGNKTLTLTMPRNYYGGTYKLLAM